MAAGLKVVKYASSILSKKDWSRSLDNSGQSDRIDCFDDPFFAQRESTASEKPERMFSRADQAPAIDKLAYFMSKSHLKIDHTL